MPISESIQLGLMGAGAIVMALFACDNTIDTKRLEKKITEMFDEQLELEVKEVDCPKDIKREKGKEFECEVSIKPKGKVTVTVEVKDDSGSMHIETKHQVMIPKKLEKILKKGGVTDPDCGKKVRTVKPGKKFSCKSGDGKEIEITPHDDKSVTWKVK